MGGTMARKRHKPEEIVAKLRQVDVLVSQGAAAAEAIRQIGVTEVTAKQVGIELFGPYVLAVELASILLLAGLVTAYHLGREEKNGEVLSVPRTASRSAQEGDQQ